jgi:hypothetical protein
MRGDWPLLPPPPREFIPERTNVTHCVKRSDWGYEGKEGRKERKARCEKLYGIKSWKCIIALIYSSLSITKETHPLKKIIIE